LFGRNLDYPTLGQLHQYSLVTIYRPKGKKAFASIGFPGLIGCLSGINREGLALAVHEVHTSRDNSPRLNTKGIPYTMCFRRVLEECRNVSEAEKLLRSLPRTTFLNLAVCDQQGGVIFEITPKNLVVRKGENGLTPCTNHFRTQTLSTGVKCWRYPLLVEAFIRDKLDRNDVTARLHAVNQGGATLQTMVFAPKELKLYLAIGQCPSSALPLKELALKELFEPNTQVEIPNKLNTQ
jgi:predicted choloylglycine hydrolase